MLELLDCWFESASGLYSYNRTDREHPYSASGENKHSWRIYSPTISTIFSFL